MFKRFHFIFYELFLINRKKFQLLIKSNKHSYIDLKIYEKYSIIEFQLTTLIIIITKKNLFSSIELLKVENELKVRMRFVGSTYLTTIVHSGILKIKKNLNLLCFKINL